jgi:hypothetical protein
MRFNLAWGGKGLTNGRMTNILMRRYLDNFNNESSNKYEKNIKNIKDLLDMFFNL